MTTPSRVPILAVALLAGGCASARFGTLESVLKGDRLATASELQEVRVERAGARPPTTPGMEIRKGDRIVTGPDTRVLVSLGAGYELILEPGTDVEVLNPSLFMRVGQAFVQTAQRVREYLKIKTEFVVAGVEGTQFVATLKGQEFLVSVVEGHVKVESPTGAWPPRTYGPLDQGRVRRGQPPERMAPLDPRQVDAIRARFRGVDDIVRRKVPRLIGARLDVARAALEQAGLAIGRVTPRITGDAAVNSVLAQSPSAGAVVRAGARVDLTVEGESVAVPSVVGQPLRAAVAALSAAGLSVSRPREVLSEREAEGTVLSQSHRAFSRVAPGATIDLTVAVAGVRVPDLTRLDRQRALSRLREAGLAPGQVSPLETSAFEAGMIAGQRPGAGTLVPRGTVVHLQVASAPATCRVPPLRGQTEAGAKATLSRAGLRLGRVQRSGDSSSARDQVTEQTPATGSVVPCGTAVAVWIPGRID
jgi:beta-lactam-binding protein with PASTA domain